MLGRIALLIVVAGVGAPAAHAKPARRARPAQRAKPALLESPEAQVAASVRARLGEIARCRPKTKHGAPLDKGRVDAGFAITWMGKVRAATINEDTTGSPTLRDCIAQTMLGWSFPKRSLGEDTLAEAYFVFDDHGVSVAATAAAAPKLAAADAPRAFLLRYGGQFVPLACVARGRSFLARACLDRMALDPRLGVEPGYLTDQAIASVARDRVYDAWDELDMGGFRSLGWPGSPPAAQHRLASPGPQDGYATWPPKSFEVKWSPCGRDAAQAGIAARCGDEPWLACSEANERLPATWDERLNQRKAPVWKGPLGDEARRLVAPISQRWKKTSPPRLLQTFSLDLDGDGAPELLHNVVFTDLEEREGPGGAFPLDSPGELDFLFVERRGHLARVPVETAASHVDKMDGLVMGWMDLDGDGRPEVWMETPRNHGHTTQLVRFEAGAFRPVAELGFTYYGDAPD